MFLVLRSYLEFFRLFKYEEYLRSFNPFLFRNFNSKVSFLRAQFVFFKYKRSLCCNRILIYHAVFKNWVYGRLVLNKTGHYENISFTKFILLSCSVFMFVRSLFFYFLGNFSVFIYYTLYKSLLWGGKTDQIDSTVEILDSIYLVLWYEDIIRSYFKLFYNREFCRLMHNSSFYFYALLFSVKDQEFYDFFFYRLMYFFIYDYISSDFLVDLAEYELREWGGLIEQVFKFFLDLFFSRIHVRQLFLFRLRIFKFTLDNLLYRLYNVKRGHFHSSGLCLNHYLSLQGIYSYHLLRNIRNTLKLFAVNIDNKFYNISYKYVLYMVICDFFFKLSERLLKFDLFYKLIPWSILVMYLRYNQYRNFRFYFYYWMCCKNFFYVENSKSFLVID